MQGVYVPEGWGQFWLPKLAAAQAGTGKAALAIPGDSVTQGCYASTFPQGWAGLLGLDLRGANGSADDGGSGFNGAANSPTYITTLASASVAANYASSLWSLTGTWTVQSPSLSNSNFYADGPGSIQLMGAAGATATTTVRGTTVTVYVFRVANIAQTATLTIDGVDNAITIPSVATGTILAFSFAVGAGNHTLKFTVNSVGSGTVVYLCGFSGENASGLVVNNFAASGVCSNVYSNVTGNQSTINGATTSTGSGTLGPAGLWSGGPAYPADLVVYPLGLNDVNNARTVDRFAHDLSTYLQGLKNGGTYNGIAYSPNGQTEVLLVSPFYGNFGNVQTSRFGPEYALRTRSVAAHFNAAHVDLNVLWRNSYAYAQGLGYMAVASGATPGASGSDPCHLSDPGHAAQRSAILPVVLGKVGAQTLPVIR